jgi:sulfide:quinone oxidoreductase
LTADRIKVDFCHLETFAMAIHSLSNSISVTEQIAVADLPAIAQAGFKSVICNRPDGEAADQPHYDQIEVAAKSLGLSVGFLPVVAGAISDEHVALFEKMMSAMPHPVLAYCRTGTRSTILWSLSQASHLSSAEILATAAQAGYDLSALAPRIQAIQSR